MNTTPSKGFQEIKPASTNARLLSLTLITAVALYGSGCATKTQGQAVGIGAVTGGAIGAGIGAIFGGEKGAVVGAGIGAGVGALAGQSYAKHLEKERAKYRTEEERLNATLEAARRIRQDANDKVTALANRVTEEQVKVEALKAAIVANKKTQTDLVSTQKALAGTQADFDAVRKNIESGIIEEKRILASLQKDSSHAKSLENEITSMSGELDRLKENENRLLGLIAALEG